jgi:hypothetical protein
MKLFERIRHAVLALSFGAMLHGFTHEAAHFAHEVFLVIGAESMVKSVAFTAETMGIKLVHADE